MSHNHHTIASAGQPPPPALPVDPYLTAIAQWLPVLLVPRTDGRTDKLPLHASTGLPHDAHDPGAWTTYDRALTTAQAGGPQFTVGFVITTADDLFCLDIDGALQADGTWSSLAQQLVAGMPGCFVEVSQSGRGLHVWGRYPSPPAHLKKRVDLHIELYTERRFIAIGTPLTGQIAPRCDALPSLVAQVFPPREQTASTVPSSGPRADWRGPTDDDDLIRRARQSRSVAAQFDGKATFDDLWTMNTDALAREYPPDNSTSEPFDRSSADAALALHLAFWTGCDVERIERLMRRSALVRDKWDNRSDYLVERTIMGACSVQTQVLQDKDRNLGPMTILAPLPADPLAGLSKWAVTAEHVKNMEGTKLIWRDALAASHIVAWVAPGNGGKTSIALFAAEELAAAGQRVFFFQEDAAAGDLPALFARAQRAGYELLNSTLARSSPGEQVAYLLALAKSDTDLQGCVFIFDTLKKFVDLMSKGSSREFFQLLRMLSGRGATVLLLGHTNKHVGHDGKPVFEGVGDVRNDVDELAYLQSTEKDAFGCVTVTLKQDKTRCKVVDLSFQLDTRTRAVTVLAERVDVAAIEALRAQKIEDAPIIAAIDRALDDGPKLHTELCKAIAAEGLFGQKAVARVVDRYTSTDRSDPHAIWHETPLKNNARQISKAVRAHLLATVGPPCEKVNT